MTNALNIFFDTISFKTVAAEDMVFIAPADYERNSCIYIVTLHQIMQEISVTCVFHAVVYG